MSIDSTIHSYSRLERELGDFLKLQRSRGVEPTDDDLQKQARIIIYEFDDGWNQTAADNASWLEEFRGRHPAKGQPVPSEGSLDIALRRSFESDESPLSTLPTAPSPGSPDVFEQSSRALGPLFLNDANCYRRLKKELRRWLLATTSPHNPARHVPSDAEIQHQARWIIYGDDDPWNQTAADNAEWLQRFRCWAGISEKQGPGLPTTRAWALEQGGSGFAPPYLYPKGRCGQFDENLQVAMEDGAKAIPAEKVSANSFLYDMTHRFPQPGSIFCSRELEQGLINMTETYFARMGVLPSDEAMRAHAKSVVNMDATAADDTVLLGKFRAMMEARLGQAAAAPVQAETLAPSMDLGLTDEQVESMLRSMEFKADNDSWFHMEQQDDQDEVGGVSLLSMDLTGQ
jgi:hypothetical protein